ncbi:unnamed protein product [Pedinophyceae sp. YPF-701]|nr:unnamed protein product [Pedinophyceae sp. YPF-701]
MVAGAAAAILMTAPAAEAGVVYTEKPQLKNFAEEAPKPEKKKKEMKAPVTKEQKAAEASAPKPKVESKSEGPELDPRLVGLPGSIAVILGGGFLLSKLDPEFVEFMDEASCKDSTSFAGNEVALKAEGGPAVGKPKRAGTGLFGKN